LVSYWIYSFGGPGSWDGINGTSTIDDFPSYKPHFASGITQLGLMTQDTVYPEKDPNIIPFLSPLNPY
jgi:hypothetical protein